MISDEIQLEHIPCPLGCSLGDDIVVIGRDRLHNIPGQFTVVRCRTCGLMRTNPRPSPDSIGLYYPDDYGPYQGTRIDSNTSNYCPVPLCKRLGKMIFQFNTQRLPHISPGKMLEIGCASGAFLHKMAGMGWKVKGLEFSEHAATSARELGYTVHTGTMESAPDPEDAYDLIVGWMVLEHLHYPLLALKKLQRWIRPGGWLVFSVPNAASMEFRLFGNLWYALQLPTHLYHYTPRTLVALLAHAGWRMEKVFHQRVLSNLIVSLGYCLEEKKPCSRLTKLLVDFPNRGVTGNMLLYPLAYALSLFAQTGRMTVWARKIK